MKNLRTITIIIASLLTILTLNAQNYQWANSIGSTGSDWGYSIATDNSSNVYITGSFFLTVDFDPGTDSANLTSNGNYDILFAKYDPNGNFIWAKSIGSVGADEARSIAVDGNGYVYITGWFRDTADFDPGAGTANLISEGATDIFFAKYDPDGNYIWAKKIGNTGYNEGHSIAIDSNNNVYITGKFNGPADFDPSADTVSLTGSGIFFARYDVNGNYLWAKSIYSSGLSKGRSITTDSNSNVYITGSFNSTTDFDPGADTAVLTSPGIYDIFFAKYDANGNYLWANKIGGNSFFSNAEGRCIITDINSNVYITGWFEDTADFDSGVDTVNFISAGFEDIFFAKYDANGNYLWANNIGSSGYDKSFGITLDLGGNIYITGKFQYTSDFDPGIGAAYLNSAGSGDIFFAKYDANGNYLWANKMGWSNEDGGNGIITDNNGNVYITGVFRNTVDFDPGVGATNLTSNGWFDIFFAKYYTGSVGIPEYNSRSSFRSYPNPSSGIFMIETDSIGENIPWHVTDITGRIIKHGTSSGTHISIDLSKTNNGVYMFKVNNQTVLLVKE